MATSKPNKFNQHEVRKGNSMIRNILALCVATLLGGISTQALAQAYPNKPIKIIVPAGPGDSCDILTRLIAPKLTERLGQATPWAADKVATWS